MLHPRFFALAAPAVTAAALLFAPGAEAAPHGGGAHGGAHVGGAHVGAAHVGVAHVGGAHVGVAHVGVANVGTFHAGAAHFNTFRSGGFGGVGVFVGPGYRWGYPYGYGYGGGYGGYGGGYGYGYYPAASAVYGADYYAAPAYPPSVPTPSLNDIPPGNLPRPGGGSPQPDLTAHVSVRVPGDAEIWFGESKTSQTGAQREFVSPPLAPGKEYTYEIRARWIQDGKEVVQTRRVDVGAGSYATLDFTKPAAEAVEPPKPKQ
jgi:uncharacterized protein (TIGR03000 family)